MYEDFVFQTVIPKTVPTHRYVAEIQKQPTKEASGIVQKTCACGDTFTYVIPKLNETDYRYEITKAATSTENGTAVWTLRSDASIAITEEIEKIGQTGHTLQLHEAKDATCTESGNTAYYRCEDCGKFFRDAAGTEEITENSWVIPASGHTHTYAITADPSLKQEGSITATCANEGCKEAAIYVVLPKLEELAAKSEGREEAIDTYVAGVVNQMKAQVNDLPEKLEAVKDLVKNRLNELLTTYLKGDVNSDGVVNGMDLLRLQKYLAGYDVEINEWNSNVNGDEKINGMDLLRLQKYLAGFEVILE